VKRSEILAVVLIAGIWNSVVAWLFIGLLWGFVALNGKPEFDPTMLLVWPAIVVLGYLMLWRDERS